MCVASLDNIGLKSHLTSHYVSTHYFVYAVLLVILTLPRWVHVMYVCVYV